MALTSEVPRRDINTPIQKDRNLAEDIRLKVKPNKFTNEGDHTRFSNRSTGTSPQWTVKSKEK